MPKAKKERSDLWGDEWPVAPSKVVPVVVITVKYTYHGVILAYGKQDGLVKRVLISPDDKGLFGLAGDRWESVHDVFEVE
jgi:hypothetical protein